MRISPALLGAGSSLALISGLLLSSPGAAVAASQSITVGANGDILTIEALASITGFQPDETLVVRDAAAGYSVALIGEDAQPRLVATLPCTGSGSEVICPRGAIDSIDVDYTRATASTQTVIQVPLDVTFQGGSADDYFQSSSGNDSLNGGPGDDVLFGDDEEGPFGDDTITGGPGDDIMYGYGGTNTLYAEDGERDSRVECADPDIAGSSGQATWDENLDRPIQCAKLDRRPGPPRDFEDAPVGWLADRFTVGFNWNPPSFNADRVTGYRLTIQRGGKTITNQTYRAQTTSALVYLNQPSPGEYLASLVAIAGNEESDPTTRTFSVYEQLSIPNVKSLRISAPRDPRSAVQLKWGAPEGKIPGSNVNFSQFVTGYQIERMARDDFWSGPPQLIDLEPNRRIFTDSCVPPGVPMFYRIRVKYRIFGAPEDSYSDTWLERWAQSVFVPKTPRPTTVSTGVAAVIPTDTPTVSGTMADRVTVTSSITGGLAASGECFGVLHQLQDKQTGRTYASFDERARPGVSDQRVGPRRFEVAMGNTSTQAFTMRSQRSLDQTWQQNYGQGFSAAGIAGANYLLSQYSSVAAVDLPGTSIYSGGGVGVKVRNLTAAWEQGSKVRVTFDPPDPKNPNSTNVRGYEICIMTDRARVHNGDYPTTSRIICSIHVPENISTGVDSTRITWEFDRNSWCTPGGYYYMAKMCPLLVPDVYVQVRPWVGSVRLLAYFDGTVWEDWNRNTWVAVKPK